MYVFHILPCGEPKKIEGVLGLIWLIVAKTTGLINTLFITSKGWCMHSYLKAGHDNLGRQLKKRRCVHMEEGPGCLLGGISKLCPNNIALSVCALYNIHLKKYKTCQLFLINHNDQPDISIPLHSCCFNWIGNPPPQLQGSPLPFQTHAKVDLV